MKKVMARAWEIARAAVVKFGGNVKEYFAASLRAAWAEVKKPAQATLTLKSNRISKTWVAKIVGTHVKFGLNREFVELESEDRGRGRKTWSLADGIYEVCENNKRWFACVENGIYEEVRATWVHDQVATMVA